MTNPKIKLTLVVPLHNEADILESSLAEFAAKFTSITSNSLAAEIDSVNAVIVENGSSDGSKADLEKLLLNQPYKNVFKIAGSIEPNAGLGFAYAKGLALALKEHGTQENHWIMLSVLDLPFGFTDFDGFICEQPKSPEVTVFIGSKAANGSEVDMGLKRKLANLVFRSLRFLVLGLKTKDPQGVIFVRSDKVAVVLEKIKSRNFFFTTELIYALEKQSCQIIELPVKYFGERRKSSVRVFRDGLAVIKELIRLRLSNLYGK